MRLRDLIPASFVVVVAVVIPAVAWAQAFISGQNLAGAAGGEIQVWGVSHSACVMQAPMATATGNVTVAAGESPAEIVFTQLVDSRTAVPIPANIAIEFPIICNSAHRVTVRTQEGGLVLSIPAPAPGPELEDRLSYQLSATWAGNEASGASDTLVPVDINVPHAAAGNLALSIQIMGGGSPLVAGPYEGSIVVELQPAN